MELNSSQCNEILQALNVNIPPTSNLYSASWKLYLRAQLLRKATCFIHKALCLYHMLISRGQDLLGRQELCCYILDNGDSPPSAAKPTCVAK